MDEAVQSSPANAAPKDLTRAKREIGFAVGKLLRRTVTPHPRESNGDAEGTDESCRNE